MLTADTRLRDAFKDQSIRLIVEFSMDNIDQGLPAWARRSHPIILRHLGTYWKTFTPDVNALTRMFGVLAIVTLCTALIPILYTLLIPTATVSLIMLPLAGWVYASLLYNVGSFAASSVSTERQHDTLDILRSTPFTMREILLSKGASAIWRYIDDLNLVTLIVLLTSLPLLLILYNSLMVDSVNPLVIAAVVIAALASLTVRIFLETVMFAALGLLMGATNFGRSAAIVSTMLVGLAYVIMINGARALPLDVGLRVLIEVVLPVALPLTVTAGCVLLTTHLLQRD